MNWFGAEGVQDGQVLLTRGRYPNGLIGKISMYPELLSVELGYQASDEIGLPTSEQYKILEKFELEAIDPIESKSGALALVKTTAGIVRYCIYVSSIDHVVQMVSAANHFPFKLSFAMEHDPEWQIYFSTLSAIGIDRAA